MNSGYGCECLWALLWVFEAVIDIGFSDFDGIVEKFWLYTELVELCGWNYDWNDWDFLLELWLNSLILWNWIINYLMRDYCYFGILMGQIEIVAV